MVYERIWKHNKIEGYALLYYSQRLQTGKAARKKHFKELRAGMQKQPLSSFHSGKKHAYKVNLVTNAKHRKVLLNSQLQYSINWHRPVAIATIGYHLATWEQVSQLS